MNFHYAILANLFSLSLFKIIFGQILENRNYMANKSWMVFTKTTREYRQYLTSSARELNLFYFKKSSFDIRYDQDTDSVRKILIALEPAFVRLSG